MANTTQFVQLSSAGATTNAWDIRSSVSFSVQAFVNSGSWTTGVIELQRSNDGSNWELFDSTIEFSAVGTKEIDVAYIGYIRARVKTTQAACQIGLIPAENIRAGGSRENPSFSIVYSGSEVDYIDRLFAGETWRQTFTYTSGRVTAVSAWVKQ